MIIFIYGPDTFRLARKLKEMTDEYRRRAPRLEFFVFDGQTDNFSDFIAGLRQGSLFQEKKFFVVKNPIFKKDFKEGIISNIDKIEKSMHNVVFYQEGKVLKNDRLRASLKKIAEIQEFAILEGEKIIAWVLQEFKNLGVNISLPAARAVAGLAGDDMWRAANEIQKLAHRHAGRDISVADAVREMGVLTETDIFKTVDAIGRKERIEALGFLRKHISNGDHPLYLLAMISNQFRNLLLIKSAGMNSGAARLGIHPYVFSKARQQALRFSGEDLVAAYADICRADLNIKSGKIDPETGLDILIGKII